MLSLPKRTNSSYIEYQSRKLSLHRNVKSVVGEHGISYPYLVEYGVNRSE